MCTRVVRLCAFVVKGEENAYTIHTAARMPRPPAGVCWQMNRTWANVRACMSHLCKHYALMNMAVVDTVSSAVPVVFPRRIFCICTLHAQRHDRENHSYPIYTCSGAANYCNVRQRICVFVTASRSASCALFVRICIIVRFATQYTHFTTLVVAPVRAQ